MTAKAMTRPVPPVAPSGLGTDSSNAGNDGGEPRSVLGVRNIAKSFGPIAALRNVSLDVGPGEIRGICGENGAGKSTLVKILTGVYRPDEGTVTVDGASGERRDAASGPGAGHRHRGAGTEPLCRSFGRGQHLARLAASSFSAQAAGTCAIVRPRALALLGRRPHQARCAGSRARAWASASWSKSRAC